MSFLTFIAIVIVLVSVAWAARFWKTDRAFAAFVILIAMSSAGFVLGAQSIHQANQNADEAKKIAQSVDDERIDRVNTQSSVTAFFCQENNRQDKQLGQLVAVSAPFLSGAELKEFERIGRDLNDPTDCRDLSLQLAEAAGLDASQVKITPIRVARETPK